MRVVRSAAAAARALAATSCLRRSKSEASSVAAEQPSLRPELKPEAKQPVARVLTAEDVGPLRVEPSSDDERAYLLNDWRPRWEPPPASVYSEYLPSEQFQSLRASLWEPKYGRGSYQFYRSLYKDLCEEMRVEREAKPPPPFNSKKLFHVNHKPGTNYVSFYCEGDQKKRIGDVYAYANLKFCNPPIINPLIVAVDWHPLDVCVVRNNIVANFNVKLVENHLNLRNVKMFRVDPKRNLALHRGDTDYVREQLRYDGPYLGHLEADFHAELWDLMMDHEINMGTTQWMTTWKIYFEHVEYCRWALKLLKGITVPGNEPRENEVLTLEERKEIDRIAEEWLPPHNK